MRISYWSSDVGSSDLLARGDVAGKAALRAGHDLVADADVGEGAPHHDLVIAAAGAVGVELPRRHLVLGEVGAGRAVLLDRARRGDVSVVTESARTARVRAPRMSVTGSGAGVLTSKQGGEFT